MEETHIALTRLSVNETTNRAGDVDLSTTLWCYVWPLIFTVGVSGNTLILLVLRRGGYGRTSASVYLCLLAGADTLVLAFGFLDGFLRNAWDVAVTDSSAVACRLIWFLQPSFATTAIWIMVAFTVERFMGVCFPMRRLQSPRQAYVIAAALLVAALLKNTDTIYVMAPRVNGTDTCTVSARYFDYEDYIRPWIAFTFTSLIPFMAILFCNVMIIRTLRNRASSTLVPPAANQQVAQITIMCVSVSFVFLVCYSPGSVVGLASRYWRNSSAAFRAVERDVITVSACLRYVHHSTNIFLYCLTGAQFRKDLWCLFGGLVDKLSLCGMAVTARRVCSRAVMSFATTTRPPKDMCVTLV